MGNGSSGGLVDDPKHVEASAVSFIFVSTIALISSGVKVLVSFLYSTSSLGLSPCWATLNGQCFMSDWTVGSSNLRPISLLASKMVLVGLMATWFLAGSPISLSVSVKATYEGVVLLPWSLAMISTWTEECEICELGRRGKEGRASRLCKSRPRPGERILIT